MLKKLQRTYSMIETWSDLYNAFKVWWHTPISLKVKVEKKPEPQYRTEDLLRPIPPHGDYPHQLSQEEIHARLDSIMRPSRGWQLMAENEKYRRQTELHIRELNEALNNLPDLPPDNVDKNE